MSVVVKIVKAYTGVTASCMIAHNITDPLLALDWDCFTEASKTGGVFAVLVAIGVAVQQYQTQTEGAS
jgi:hypothetical protein